MAKLSVNNNIFRYKNTFYQIPNIISLRQIEQRKEKKEKKKLYKNYMELFKVLVIFIVISVGAIFIPIIIFYKNEFYMTALTLVFVGVFFVYMVYREINKNKMDKNKKEYNYMYGIVIVTSDKKANFFWSSNKETIKKTSDAILSAMNKEKNVSVTFENVDITISDSENIDIGKISG